MLTRLYNFVRRIAQSEEDTISGFHGYYRLVGPAYVGICLIPVSKQWLIRLMW